MKYYRITYFIRDGEYEYLNYAVVKAETVETAKKKAVKNDEDWIKEDYREIANVLADEIEKADYEVLKKYIYNSY